MKISICRRQHLGKRKRAREWGRESETRPCHKQHKQLQIFAPSSSFPHTHIHTHTPHSAVNCHTSYGVHWQTSVCPSLPSPLSVACPPSNSLRLSSLISMWLIGMRIRTGIYRITCGISIRIPIVIVIVIVLSALKRIEGGLVQGRGLWYCKYLRKSLRNV